MFKYNKLNKELTLNITTILIYFHTMSNFPLLTLELIIIYSKTSDYILISLKISFFCCLKRCDIDIT